MTFCGFFEPKTSEPATKISPPAKMTSLALWSLIPPSTWIWTLSKQLSSRYFFISAIRFVESLI